MATFMQPIGSDPAEEQAGLMGRASELVRAARLLSRSPPSATPAAPAPADSHA